MMNGQTSKKIEKILITGGAGFVGSNLANSLIKDYDITIIDNISTGTLENVTKGSHFYQYDIINNQWAIEKLFEVNNFDVVFHLAATTCLADCNEYKEHSVKTNVLGTLNILENCYRTNVSKLIFADTSAEYEFCPERYLPAVANHHMGDVLYPKGIYAASKAGAFLLCRAFERMYNLNISYTRYMNVFGPSQDFRRVNSPVMSSFIKKLFNDEQPIIYGDGNKERDFIYVDDVNSLNKLIMLSDYSRGKIYDVGTGRAKTIMSVYKEVAKQLNKQHISPKFEENREWEANKNVANLSEAFLLGWKQEVSFEDGIAKQIAYMRNRI